MRSEFRLQLKSLILTLFALSIFTAAAHANGLNEIQDFTKTIKKEFPINTNGTVALSNKYGKVDVKTWDKNRVKIDVTIVVKARSESAAKDVFDRIGIDFTNSDSYVKAETTIGSNQSRWWNWGSGTNSEFQINYEVFMPASCSVDLANKYGNSTVDAINGKASISVKYGDVRLNGVGGSLNIMLGYGNGTVVKANDVAADISYSRISFHNTKDILLSAKYSKVYVDKAANIRAESSYDNLNFSDLNKLNISSRYGNVIVGKVEAVSATSKYTDYKIDGLASSGDFELQYGGLSLNKLARGFSSLNLVGKYTNFKITIEPNASYSLDAVSSYARITYPPALQVSYEKDKNTSMEVRGSTGGSGSKGTIKATVNYGGLTIR